MRHDYRLHRIGIFAIRLAVVEIQSPQAFTDERRNVHHTSRIKIDARKQLERDAGARSPRVVLSQHEHEGLEVSSELRGAVNDALEVLRTDVRAHEDRKSVV